MMDEKQQLAAMGLIMNGGNAKGAAMQAIAQAKTGNFEKADEYLKQADQFLIEAHNSQTEMLTNDAQVMAGNPGELTPVNLLMVHAQDHLMTAITFNDLATEIVDLYRRK